MQIRVATIKDVKKVSQINRKCRQQNFKGIVSDVVLEGFTEEKAYHNRQWFFKKENNKNYVLEGDGKMLWFCSLIQHNWENYEIYALYIDPEYQGMWHWWLLLNYIFDMYPSKELFLRTLKENMATNKFYEKHGWVESGMKEIVFGWEKYLAVKYKR